MEKSFQAPQYSFTAVSATCQNFRNKFFYERFQKTFDDKTLTRNNLLTARSCRL